MLIYWSSRTISASEVHYMDAYLWYQRLIRPSWAPPSWLFGPVWTVLYIGIAISFGTVLVRAFQKKLPKIVILPFLLNLLFNAAFTPLQFGLRNNLLACDRYPARSRNTDLGHHRYRSAHSVDRVCTDPVSCLGFICHSSSTHDYFLEYSLIRFFNAHFFVEIKNSSFSARVHFFISASRFRATVAEDAFFFHTSSTGRWLRVYAAPFPALCFLSRSSRLFEIPIYRLPSPHRSI
jgi:hypothetical protein